MIYDIPSAKAIISVSFFFATILIAVKKEIKPIDDWSSYWSFLNIK